MGSFRIFSVCSFQWLAKCEIDESDMNEINKDSSKGFILEVDLEYPVVLLNVRYVLYLQLYLKLRLKLTKNHRALLFEQDQW